MILMNGDSWIMKPIKVGESNELEAEEGREVRSNTTKLSRRLNQIVFILVGYLEMKRKTANTYNS